ncbi:MFS transporter [Falsibacillus pallidus]|uniref:MFS transporter n=1 Tax=Falsibacillus pallidus TaxID=493781 RepID=A0A370GPR8_9BACI|nr:MFS transporter [Falsibacillus pallidus]RDI45521.1 MFS transporter [Falsibacillus pallidus]
MIGGSRGFKLLWMGEVVSEFGGAAGGIINGLLLFEWTGSKEWMGAIWLIYFLPSLVMQGVSAPFLNHVRKERLMRRVQVIRALAYLLPLLGTLIHTKAAVIAGLFILQCVLGLLQPIYASLGFSLLPSLCKEDELKKCNALLDGTLRIMSFLAPGIISLLLIIFPMHLLYFISSCMFLLSYVSLKKLPESSPQYSSVWSKKFWWGEMRKGYRVFFQYPILLKLTVLSSIVQFAVGAALVVNIPFIKEELKGANWMYAIFSGAFPIGYTIGTFILSRSNLGRKAMYAGLAGGGASFLLLVIVPSAPFAWMTELFGGICFPLFNAQSSALFQKLAPKERLSQLSSIRLLFIRVGMPLGILFATLCSSIGSSERMIYGIIGLVILIPALYSYFQSFLVNKKINLNI